MKPRPIDFEKNPKDKELGDLGEAGWHTRAIAAVVGLRPGQVLYRLKQAGVKRKNYRDGKSGMAQVILRLIRAHGNQRREITATENLFSEIDAQHEKFVAERQKLMKKQKTLVT